MDDYAYDDSTVTILLAVANRAMHGGRLGFRRDTAQSRRDQGSPEFSTAVATTHIIGLWHGQTNDQERMLIYIDRLMTDADMALVEAPLQ